MALGRPRGSPTLAFWNEGQSLCKMRRCGLCQISGPRQPVWPSADVQCRRLGSRDPLRPQSLPVPRAGRRQERWAIPGCSR